MKSETARYFFASSAFAIVGTIGIAVYAGHRGGAVAAAEAALTVALLSVLEISLSFDNAIVNARILQRMDAVWRRRFMTWGIAIAVFGMRVVFPLALVGVAARLWPWQALMLAINEPARYADAILAAHEEVSVFGGAFLIAVALRFFIDDEKDRHWIGLPERLLVRVPGGSIAPMAIGALGVAAAAAALPPAERASSAVAGACGLAAWLAVEALSRRLEAQEKAAAAVGSGAALFVYLEVLDASFSFDGSVSAFAITHDLFVIAAGLGIGAMFVRSLTELLVEKRAIGRFVYLEHGAYYAIGALAISMFVQSVHPLPEWFVGGSSAAILGLSFWSSTRLNRRNRAANLVRPNEL